MNKLDDGILDNKFLQYILNLALGIDQLINVILLGGGIKIVAAEYLIFNRVVFFFNPFLIIGLSLACDRVRQQYVPYLLAIVFVVLLGFLILLKRGYL